jgi:hypothetical protein
MGSRNVAQVELSWLLDAKEGVPYAKYQSSRNRWFTYVQCRLFFHVQQADKGDVLRTMISRGPKLPWIYSSLAKAYFSLTGDSAEKSTSGGFTAMNCTGVHWE